MVSREVVTAEVQRDNNEQQKLLGIFDRLENYQISIKKGNTVLSNMIAVGGMDG